MSYKTKEMQTAEQVKLSAGKKHTYITPTLKVYDVEVQSLLHVVSGQHETPDFGEELGDEDEE